MPSQKYGTDLAQAIKFRNATGSWTFLDIANPVPLTLGEALVPFSNAADCHQGQVHVTERANLIMRQE